MSVWRTNKRGQSYRRKIQKVIDGDTFKVSHRVLGSQYIRIAGIDCPEKGQRGYLAAKNRLGRLKGKTVTLKLRYSDFTTLTRSRTLANYTNDGSAISAVAKELLKEATGETKRPVRLIGVSISQFKTQEDSPQLKFDLEPSL